MSEACEQMLREIEQEVQLTANRTGCHRLRPAVVEALRRVPRERFVPPELAAQAYVNRPLPIGRNQTISQPYIVAIMTELIDPGPDDRVLEIGTGCGYQAAVLAEVVDTIYSIESIPELGEAAAERLAELGYDNIHVRIGNGRAGWPDAAPFDGILVTAGAEDVPAALIEQLAPGGTLVIPVGAGRWGQQLRRVHKDAAGAVHSEDLLAVAFVPLTHG